MKTISLRFSILSIVLIVLGLLPGFIVAQTVVTNPPTPFVIPTGVTQMKVEVWGGGGAGGGTSGVSFGVNYGSGGGGGAYNAMFMTVSAGQSYTIVVGAGGTAVNNAAGGPGTASSVSGPGGTITANPGLGGARNAGTAGTGGIGGINIGGNGAVGGGATGGGGGGGAGNAAVGGAGQNGATGVNAGSAGGAGTPNVAPYKGGAGGGQQISTNAAGLPGSAPGGGGGGANTTFSNSTRTGGAGGAGQVVITYCQTFSLSSISAQTPRCVTSGNPTITLNGNLPIGSYTVTYDRSLPATSNLTASMTVSTVNTGTFVAAGLTAVGTSRITVTNIASSTAAFCTNAITSNNFTDIVVDAAATVDAGTDQLICATSNVPLAGTFGGAATSITWSGGSGSYNPDNNTTTAIYSPSSAEISAGSATLTLTTDNPPGACGATSDQITIAIKKIPTAINITPTNSTICVGNNQLLTASATVNYPPLSSENFNTTGSFTYAAAGTTSGLGTIFSQRASGYGAGLTTITNNDASQFMIATATNIGAGNTNSTLTSPVINTTGYANLNLSFRHTYQKGQEAGVSVQVSTNGGSSWSNISTAGAVIATNTYTTNQGANNNFVPVTINLNSFVNNANFRIRFNFISNISTATSWWAIDDILLNGITPPVFSWTASTGAGINGLPTGAGTLSTANNIITVNPTLTTIYTLTASDPVSNCSVSTITATVNVNQNSTLGLSSGAGTNAQAICMPGAITDITYDIGGGGTGASISAGSLPTGLTASYSNGVFTISGTPTEFGNFSYTATTTGPCVNQSLSGTLSINTAPGLTCQDVVTNTDPGVCLATRTYAAIATGFPAPFVSYLVNGEFIEFPYDFPLGVTVVDVLAEGSCAPDATCSFTVTVNDLEAPLADLVLLPDATGECSVSVADAPTATDACEGTITGTTTDPLIYNSQGTFTITWVYMDSKGNSTTQDQTVIVNDITQPDITCPPAQTFCTVPGNNFTIPVLVASDNCTISSVSYVITGATSRSGTGNDASGLFNPGVSTIEWTVTDGNNNSSVCTTTVSIIVTPPAPVVTGIVNVCPYLGTGDQITYTAFSAGATSYNWTLPPNIVVVSGLGTGSLTLMFNNALSSQPNKQLRVTASNSCGTSTLSIFYLLTQFPVTPAPISGPTNVCQLIGTTNTADYSISPVIAATGYAWNIPAGTDSTHPNPPGINDTIIRVTFNDSFAGGNIVAIATNGCGISGTRTLTVSKTPSSVPGLISGPINVCANILPGGTAATYSIAPVNGATSYTWTAPPGSTINHPNGTGANDVAFTIQFPPGFNSGALSVSSTNGCGTSGLRSLAVNKLNPATPSVIDVIQVGFCEDVNGRVYTYTLASMPANATSVQWTIPVNATLVSGQGSISIAVSYPSSSVDGNVTAQAINSCASSTIRKSIVKLPACPPPGFTKTGSGNNDQRLPLVRKIKEVRIFPNPSVSDFNLQVLSSADEIINVRISDMQGRQFKTLTVLPYQTVQVGSDLKAGSYIVEIVQGDNKITKKILKF